MNSKPKGFWCFYIITAVILAGTAAIPLWNFLVMVLAHYRVAWLEYNIYMAFAHYREYNVNLVIPFAAVLTAVFAGFLLLPLLHRRSLSLMKKHIIASLWAVIIFLGLEAFAEHIAAHREALWIVMTSRRFMLPEEIAALTANMTIPWAIRAHYYLFSIILILAVLNFLYNLANNLYGDEKPCKQNIILQGLATVCYVLIYFFVGVMQYKNYQTMQLNGVSILWAAGCFILAAVVVGLYCSSLLQNSGVGKLMPSIASGATVVALYIAELVMLEGRFYLYSNNVVVDIFLRLVIIIVPSVIVYWKQNIANFLTNFIRSSEL